MDVPLNSPLVLSRGNSCVRRGSVSRQACFHMLGAFSAPSDLINTRVIPQFMLPWENKMHDL